MKKFLTVSVILILLLTLASCTQKPTAEEELTKVTLVLDWVPNTNHTGFYVAQEKGFFAEQGLDVEIIQPVEGGSAQLIGAERGQFGVSYQEEVAYSRAADIPVVAVAAIIQNNTSGFASPASKNIATPSDFAGKKYGGWGSPVEIALIDALMSPYSKSVEDVEIVNIGSADFFTSVEKDVDFTWIYYGWTGIEAELRGFDINFILLQDIEEALNFYTPVIIVNETLIQENPEMIKSFLTATTKGYTYAIENPEDAAQVLLSKVPELDHNLVVASQKFLAEEYQADAPRWGMMKEEVWLNYTRWMLEAGLLEKNIDINQAFTNEFLPE
jgi:ABC-type nitrate/sulfonate/bicarbonate transport system substrate-binding protein